MIENERLELFISQPFPPLVKELAAECLRVNAELALARALLRPEDKTTLELGARRD